MLLNILKDLKEVRIAFELMEGKAIAYGTGSYSIESALIDLERFREYKEIDKYFSFLTVAVIYGSGGVHRYFVRPDGTIKFSTFHMGWKDVSKDAKLLGFIID